MTYYMIESDDDFLFTEEANIFMEKASAPVKKSFLSRMVEAVKRLIGKISEFINRAISKFRGKDIEKKVKSDPKAAKTKVNMKNYDKAVDEGISALNKIDKAKSTAEAKKIASEYQAKRKKILSVAIPTTLIAIAAAVGGGLFLKHRSKLNVVSDAAKDAEAAITNKATTGSSDKEIAGSTTQDTQKSKKSLSVSRNAPKLKQSAKETKKENNEIPLSKEKQKVAAKLKTDLEKAIIKMQTSEHTLQDMSAGEKQVVEAINRRYGGEKTFDRMTEHSSKIFNRIGVYDQEREKLYDKLETDKTLSTADREKIQNRIKTLTSMIENGRRAGTNFIHRGLNAIDKTDTVHARHVPDTVFRNFK